MRAGAAAEFRFHLSDPQLWIGSVCLLMVIPPKCGRAYECTCAVNYFAAPPRDQYARRATPAANRLKRRRRRE